MFGAIQPVAARLCAVGAAAVVFPSFAHAHITLEWQAAPAGSAYKAQFKIGHGCGASPTRQVSVDIPSGVRGARPSPKPGWSLEIRRAPLAEPYDSHGRRVTDDVVRITWTARTREDMLPTDQYDEFVLVAQMPRQPGTLWWPVSQVCEEGRLDWTQVPRPGQPAAELKSPAARLEILPSAGAAGHKH